MAAVRRTQHGLAAFSTNDAGTNLSRIPSDVLCIIFEEAQAFEEMHGRLLFAIKLLLVCTLWRDIAVDTSSLWTTVHVPLERRPVPIPLRAYLARSNLRSLDIIVERHPGDAPLLNEVDLRAYMVALMEHIDRWRSLVLDAGMLETWEFKGLFWEMQKWVRPTCANIKLVNGAVVGGVQLFSADICAPALRRLTLWSTPTLGHQLAVTQAFPGLRDLTLLDSERAIDMQLGPYMELFAALPLLERLRLVGTSISLWHAPGQTRPKLFTLKEIWLEDMWPTTMSGFFRAMYAPRLERVMVKPRLSEGDWMSGFQQAPILESSRWFPRLRTLNLELEWSFGHIKPYPKPGDFATWVVGFEHFQLTTMGNVNTLVTNALMHSFMRPELFEKTYSKGFTMQLVKIEACSDLVSASALLRKLKWCAEPELDDQEEHEGRTSIKGLDLAVYSSTQIDDKSLAWFRSQLKSFSWRLKDGTNMVDNSVKLHYHQPKPALA